MTSANRECHPPPEVPAHIPHPPAVRPQTNHGAGFWFSTPERLASLHAEALSWVGTPWFPNSSTKGQGVSCQKLACEIYRAIGCVDTEVPEVPMSHARFSSESLLEKWVSARPDFSRVDAPMGGDLLGFRIGRTVHHCGIYLGRGEFIHAIDHIGTVISQLNDATWSSRLAFIWRPHERPSP